MRRRNHRADSNQAALLRIWAQLGGTSYVIDGAFDVLLGAHGRDVKVEIKDGAKPPSARKLTEGEEKFMRDWRGSEVVVITNEKELIGLWKAMKSNQQQGCNEK